MGKGEGHNSPVRRTAKPNPRRRSHRGHHKRSAFFIPALKCMHAHLLHFHNRSDLRARFLHLVLSQIRVLAA
eukprot:1160780-Pelagomonas_calceolata.AAC.2